MNRIHLAGAFAALLIFSLPAAGEEAADDRSAARVQAVESARERLVTARERAREAEAALTQAKHRRKPRGEKLEELRQEAEDARSELRRAEAALPERLDEARRAGVPPGLLRETEDWLNANPAAAAP